MNARIIHTLKHMTKRTYKEPNARFLDLELETMICDSGNSEDLTKDPVIDPWDVNPLDLVIF